MTGFYYTVPSNQQVGDITIPKDGYFAFSWRTPENSNLWKNGGGKEITHPAKRLGLPDDDLLRARMGRTAIRTSIPTASPARSRAVTAYPYTVPRVTDGTNLSFIARADGSAENMLMKLDGGVDINSQMGLGPQSGEMRDNAARGGHGRLSRVRANAVSWTAQNPEKFAAVDTTRCRSARRARRLIVTTVGSEAFTENNGTDRRE